MKRSKQKISGLLDLHSHMLPGMDDGSESPEESLEMVRESVRQGVRHLAMTPHFYPRREAPERFLRRRERAIGKLAAALQAEKRVPEIFFGAEVEFFDGISRVDEMKEMCIGYSDILLVEMPFCRWSHRVVSELINIRDHLEVRPVLAHIERYLDYQDDEAIREILDQGIYMQANGSFFLRRSSARTAMKMLKNGHIHLLGSDSHNLDSRPPNLGLAAEKILAKCGEDALSYLFRMQELVLKR